MVTKFIKSFIAYLLLSSMQAYGNSNDLHSWVEANSISIPELQAPLTSEEQQTLDQALEGKRIVFLGEAAHWVHEKYDYRLRFLHYLVDKGFHYVGMEMGFSDGRRVDKFLSSGDVEDLNQVALYGYDGPYVQIRKVEGACPINSRPHRDFAELFKNEEMWFYSRLRQIGKDLLPENQRIHHFGFDVDTRPGGAYEDILLELEPLRKQAPVDSFLKTLLPHPNESLSEETIRLEKTLVALKSKKLFQILGKNQFAWVKLSLNTLIQSLRFQAVFQARPCDPSKISVWIQELLVAMAEREKVMFELVKQKLSELGPNSKIVLMGHNFHLSKDPKSLWFANTSVPVAYAPVMWPSIGEYIGSSLSLPIYSIWMIHRRGFQSNIDCPLMECTVETGPNYLGELFSGFGASYSLPLKNTPAFIDQRLDFAVNGGTYSGNITRNTDLIFFVDTVSGLRPR